MPTHKYICFIIRNIYLKLFITCVFFSFLYIFIFETSSIYGFLYYKTGWEVTQYIASLFLLGVVSGAALAAILTALVMGFWVLRHKKPSLRVFSGKANGGVSLVLTLLLGAAFLDDLLSALQFHMRAGVESGWHYAVYLVYVLLCILLVSKRKLRTENATTAKQFLSSDFSRRSVITVGTASALVWAGGRLFGDRKDVTPGDGADLAEAGTAKRPNILLITFDALNAEDMSLYGRHLPTTPNMDHFAAQATTFRHFYACSTFTTPCVTSFTTGRYVSNHRVFQLYGHLHGADQQRTLAEVLRRAGYDTAASVTNPAAHPSFGGQAGYHYAPAPPIEDPIRKACFELGAYQLYHQISDANWIALQHIRYIKKQFSPQHISLNEARPEYSFAQAKILWQKLKGQKFLHVHLFAPHDPYLPSAQFRGLFLKPGALGQRRFGAPPLTAMLQNYTSDGRHYALKYQPLFDLGRLRYDEWIANADAVFGNFLTRLEKSGQLQNTIVAVSADHGDSFQGGVFTHETSEQLRSITHVPLIIRMPGQMQKKDVFRTMDATALAPTLLDLAGLPTPEWMDGTSQRAVMESPQPQEDGYAFTQYLETNSSFAPITQGTIGVVNKDWQYVLELPSGQGRLFRLEDAHLQSHDMAHARPEIACALRERIRARFPDIVIPA